MPIAPLSRITYGTLARGSITVALLAWAFYQTDVWLTAVQWLETEWSYLILFGPLVFLAYVFIDVWRWKIILEHQRLHLPFIYLTIIYTRGVFMGAVLPGGATTGDIYRIYTLAKNTEDIKTSISSVFLYRIAGLWAVLVLCVGTFQYSLVVMNRDSFQPFLKPMMVITVLCSAIVIGFYVVRQYYFEKIAAQYPLLRHVRSFLDAIPKFFRNKTLVCQSLALAMALQLLVVAWNYVVSTSLHISVPFLTLIMTVPLINFSVLLPISLGGFGVREAGYVFFLVPFGLTPGEAISLSLIGALVQSAMHLISGVVFFYPLPPIGRDRHPKPASGRLSQISSD
jgi:glycosyltransferase 2 family protein